MTFMENPGSKQIGSVPTFKTTIPSLHILQRLPAAVYTCDAEGKITFYNDAAVNLWGRNPVIGKDLWCGSWKIFYPDGTPMPWDQCPMMIALKSGKSVTDMEIIVERPDGRRICIQPHPEPIYDSEGNLLGAINMLIDITDKKAKEKLISENAAKYANLAATLEKQVERRTAKLRKSEERYHKMVDEVEDYAILLLDREGNVQNWNKGAEKIKGYSEADIIGRNFRIFYLPEDRDTLLPERLITQAVTHGKATHEGWRLRKDGTRFWGSIVITALHEESGNVIGFSKVTRDLTERKHAEDLLRSNALDIEFRNKQLEEYAYIASHDLQEPLRKIQIFADLLHTNINNKEAVERNLDKINAAAARMSALIRDVLKYSQLSQHDELFTEVSLEKMVDNVIEDFDLLVEEKHAVITRGPMPSIQGIPVQLNQLFSNLIGNALKFSEKSPVIHISAEPVGEIEERFSHLDSSRKYIKIFVRDNGTGFDQQHAHMVFRMFQRLGGIGAGTGIGLALCKRVVENHHGHIFVESVPGQGSVFTVILPVE